MAGCGTGQRAQRAGWGAPAPRADPELWARIAWDPALKPFCPIHCPIRGASGLPALRQRPAHAALRRPPPPRRCQPRHESPATIASQDEAGQAISKWRGSLCAPPRPAGVWPRCAARVRPPSCWATTSTSWGVATSATGVECEGYAGLGRGTRPPAFAPVRPTPTAETAAPRVPGKPFSTMCPAMTPPLAPGRRPMPHCPPPGPTTSPGPRPVAVCESRAALTLRLFGARCGATTPKRTSGRTRRVC